MAGVHVQIYLWTFDRGWPQQYIIQKWMSDIYDVKVKVNSLVMCSWDKLTHIMHLIGIINCLQSWGSKMKRSQPISYCRLCLWDQEIACEHQINASTNWSLWHYSEPICPLASSNHNYRASYTWNQHTMESIGFSIVFKQSYHDRSTILLHESLTWPQNHFSI
jgi:hypothetical protein